MPRSLPHPPRPGRAVVVGDGVAGSACAAELALRGWQVTVFGLEGAASSGASGLPVGVLAPHLSALDPPSSQLSRIGVALTWEHVQEHLREGLDYQCAGVLERRVGKSAGLPARDEPGNCVPVLSRLASGLQCESVLGGAHADDPLLWHPEGGWLRPAGLVASWLGTVGVQWQGFSRVLDIQEDANEARLVVEHKGQGQHRLNLDLVVIAAGAASAGLLGPAWPLNSVRGQLSFGLMPAHQHDLPAGPINGHGSWVAHLPGRPGLAGPGAEGHEPAPGVHGTSRGWICGATYDRDTPLPLVKSADHAANLHKLERLLPAAARAVRLQFERGEVDGWAGVRCTTADRLPVIGPRDRLRGEAARVWVCTGLGSRGLSMALLCARELARRVHREEGPLPQELASALNVERLRRHPKTGGF